jgi:hypothetical protein
MPVGFRRLMARTLLPGVLLVVGAGAGVGGAIALAHPGIGRPAAMTGPADRGQAASSPSEAGDRIPADWVATKPGQPASIEIPRIHLRSRLVRLGLQADGSLEPPRDWDAPGWYGGGSIPGQVDAIPAVIAGHVDSRTGPAVFFRLHELRPGDEVVVRRGDGAVARFTVDASKTYSKRAFPNAEVYGPVDTDAPQLRLITCTGSFDRDAGGYRDDLVVFAHRTG